MKPDLERRGLLSGVRTRMRPSHQRRRRPPGADRRLGVYVDALFFPESTPPGTLLTTSEAAPFMRFICEVASTVGHLYVFGRMAPDSSRASYALPSQADLIPLPHYENLADLRAVARVTPKTLAAMWRGVAEVDAVLVFGPHPFSVPLALFAASRGKRVVLGVRQDTMHYFHARARGRGRPYILIALWVVDRSFRLMARALPTVAAGGHVEQQYGGPRRGLEALRISLIREADISAEPRPIGSGRIELLTVGRIDPEKNPFLLLDALERLEQQSPGRFHLRWVGDGILAPEVRRTLHDRGMDHLVTMTGYVEFGPRLLDCYRTSSVFVHVAITDAAPQVLMEAMAQGLPIVATDVGGVRWLVDEGRAALLVPPDDRDALVEAIEQVSDDEGLRLDLARRGIALSGNHTLEKEAKRVAVLLREG